MAANLDGEEEASSEQVDRRFTYWVFISLGYDNMKGCIITDKSNKHATTVEAFTKIQRP